MLLKVVSCLYRRACQVGQANIVRAALKGQIERYADRFDKWCFQLLAQRRPLGFTLTKVRQRQNWRMQVNELSVRDYVGVGFPHATQARCTSKYIDRSTTARHRHTTAHTNTHLPAHPGSVGWAQEYAAPLRVRSYPTSLKTKDAQESLHR